MNYKQLVLGLTVLSFGVSCADAESSAPAERGSLDLVMPGKADDYCRCPK